jgi:hypothetical protein
MRIDIGEDRKEQKIKNTSLVYQTIYSLGGEGKLSQIMYVLRKQAIMDNSKILQEVYDKYENGHIDQSEMQRELKRKRISPLSEKTVQRCAKNDPRLVWDGEKYFISQKTILS